MSQQQVQRRLAAQTGPHGKRRFRGRVGVEAVVYQRLDGLGHKVSVRLREGEVDVSIFEMPTSDAGEQVSLGTRQHDNDGKLLVGVAVAGGRKENLMVC